MKPKKIIIIGGKEYKAVEMTEAILKLQQNQIEVIIFKENDLPLNSIDELKEESFKISRIAPKYFGRPKTRAEKRKIKRKKERIKLCGVHSTLDHY